MLRCSRDTCVIVNHQLNVPMICSQSMFLLRFITLWANIVKQRTHCAAFANANIIKSNTCRYLLYDKHRYTQPQHEWTQHEHTRKNTHTPLYVRTHARPHARTHARTHASSITNAPKHTHCRQTNVCGIKLRSYGNEASQNPIAEKASKLLIHIVAKRTS